MGGSGYLRFGADSGIAMTHLVEKQTLVRANTAVMLTLVWGGLAACAFGAVVFDVGRAAGAW
jgi:hypothetical protein